MHKAILKVLSLKLVFALYLLVLIAGVGIDAVFVLVSSPENTPWYLLGAFYAGFCLAAGGLAGLGLIIIRALTGSRLAVMRNLGIIVRQSLLVGAIATLALLFQSQRILNIYTSVLLVATAGILELYFLIHQ